MLFQYSESLFYSSIREEMAYVFKEQNVNKYSPVNWYFHKSMSGKNRYITKQQQPQQNLPWEVEGDIPFPLGQSPLWK